MGDMFAPPLNFAGLTPPDNSLERAKVVILPVPYDSTTEWHSGAREGPQAIITASRYLELYDVELQREIYKVGIHTLAEVQPLLDSPKKMIRRVFRIAKELANQSKFTVMLGGEHSLTLAMVQALREKFKDLCVLQLDAHADLRDQYQGTRYSHACIMRRVSELCPVVQVGVRSLSLEEQEFISRNSMRLFGGIPGSYSSSAGEIVTSLNNEVYISIDLDVLDPSIMPAVGTPEPGGMQWHELLNLLRLVANGRRVVGFDIVELCPREGPVSCSFTAAKLAYKLIGYAVS